MVGPRLCGVCLKALVDYSDMCTNVHIFLEHSFGGYCGGRQRSAWFGESELPVAGFEARASRPWHRRRLKWSGVGCKRRAGIATFQSIVRSLGVTGDARRCLKTDHGESCVR